MHNNLFAIYDDAGPLLHGAGAISLLEIIPHPLGLQTIAQLLIVIGTTIIQIIHLLKSAKAKKEDDKTY